MALAGLASSAKAEFIIVITQGATGVTFSGSGSIDTKDLTNSGYGGGVSGLVWPSLPVIGLGDAPSADGYEGLTTDLPLFGTGGLQFSSSDTGDGVGLNGNGGGTIFVPHGYVSGTNLSGTSFFSGQTFASLGLTVGTYTASWGTGPDADSFVITTEAPVPEPAAVWMSAVGAALLGGFGLRSKCKFQRPAAD